MFSSKAGTGCKSFFEQEIELIKVFMKGFEVMLRILIVDDDPGMLFLMNEYMTAYGFQPVCANSAAQARNRLKYSKFDLIISDFNMPGESGLDLFRYVLCRYPEVPFILMTGCSDTRIKREALKMGVYRYLEKPFQFSELMKIISNQRPSNSRSAFSAPAA
jgi:DNA-binding NtrC family response regulator